MFYVMFSHENALKIKRIPKLWLVIKVTLVCVCVCVCTTSGQNRNKSAFWYKLVSLLRRLDVPVGRRGELRYLGVKFLIGPVFCYVVQVAVVIHQ